MMRTRGMLAATILLIRASAVEVWTRFRMMTSICWVMKVSIWLVWVAMSFLPSTVVTSYLTVSVSRVLK